MRLNRLVPAFFAATSLMAVAPAGALAHKHPSPSGRCRVNINVVPRRSTAGEPVTIAGQLRCQGRASAAGQVVQLYHHLLGNFGGFTYVQSTTTDSNGFYKFERADGVVDTSRAWYVRAHGAQSGRKAIRVAAEVSLVGPPEGAQLITGAPNKVTFTGVVSPSDVGARVILQRQNATTGNEWHRIDLGQVGAGGSYSITHTFVVPGDANIRVLVRSQRRNVPSASSPLTYDISQAQNPALTILSSADPIQYGQTVTISGALAGGASQPVTLLSRIRRGRYAPVAEVTTDASGDYTFPAQAPVDSTFYKVQGGGQVSAVLFEGVKDVLTAAVSATTVQAGQPLTFSGSVTPDHTGHIVYLERQDTSGAGFHVVEIGAVTAGSVYSITHVVYDAGTRSSGSRSPADRRTAARPAHCSRSRSPPPRPRRWCRKKCPATHRCPPKGSPRGRCQSRSRAPVRGRLIHLEAHAATARASRCAPTLRLTLCRALSTVFVSHTRRSPTCS